MTPDSEPPVDAALEQARAHHAAGRLAEAERLYREILAARPGDAAVLSKLGAALAGQGRFEETLDVLGRALAIDPGLADAHNNLGAVLQLLGRFEDAAAAFRRALAITPDDVSALVNLGNALEGQGRAEDAVPAFERALSADPDNAAAQCGLGAALLGLGRLDAAGAALSRALALDPDHAEAHNNLGNVLKRQGRPDDALDAYARAVALRPDFAEAHNNRGNALKALGHLDDAIEAYGQAIALRPESAAAHGNLGNALRAAGRPDDALESYRRAVVLDPGNEETQSNLGQLCMDTGRYADAQAAFQRVFEINHGGPLWNAARFTDSAPEAVPAGAEPPVVSAFRLRDTADQLDYLIGRGRIDPSFAAMAGHYRAVEAEIAERHGAGAEAALSEAQFRRLAPFHNRVVHYRDTPGVAAGVVNGGLDFAQIEDSYLASPVSVTAFDDFLTPDGLKALRDFCLESTIFFTHSGDRFVSSRVHYGFNCSILYQMADELKRHLPRVLGGHALRNIWVYRYNNRSDGVAAHTDEGAVTFNFWITPDAANEAPGRGGLVVYAKEQPMDWDWERYNADKYTDAVKRDITEFLANVETVTIPYADNRSVLFHSNLFHESDAVRFADGFENRRMNVTMLFGRREDGGRRDTP